MNMNKDTATRIIRTACFDQVDLLLDDMHEGADHEQAIERILDAMLVHFDIPYNDRLIMKRRTHLADLLTTSWG